MTTAVKRGADASRAEIGRSVIAVLSGGCLLDVTVVACIDDLEVITSLTSVDSSLNGNRSSPEHALDESGTSRGCAGFS